jgi:CHASE2 domain-containing sensor protein
MPTELDIGNIGHAIQLAVAPVFLLTGLATLLGVIANRLARVIDRARAIEARWPSLSDSAKAADQIEMRLLERRRHACSWSINFCTIAALLICLVIIALFMEQLFGTHLGWIIASLFVAAMVLVVLGLLCFLREVYLATSMTTIDMARFK